MTWERNYCRATNRDGSSCGNPSPDGRGGFCRVHQARSLRDARAKRAGERVRWYCHSCGQTHNQTPEQRDAHRDEIRAAEAAQLGLAPTHPPSRPRATPDPAAPHTGPDAPYPSKDQR